MTANYGGDSLSPPAHYLDEGSCAVALSLESGAWRIGSSAAVEWLASDVIPITHHKLARIRGVRRSGVTVALHFLKGARLIYCRHARIEVLDGKGLAAFSRPQPA